MANTVALAFASQDLTLTGQFVDTQTVVIGGKTYTTQATLTDSDGNVQIGASAEEDIDNLVAAINLDPAGAGSQYAASMTRSQHVYAVKVSATVLRVYAQVKGVVGNLIATTETQTNASWGAGTLAGGSGSFLLWLEDLLALNQINAEVISEILSLTPAED